MQSWIGALISGALLFLAYPKIGLYPLAFIGLVPVLWASSQKEPKKAAQQGLLSAWVFFSLLLYWLIPVMTHFGGINIIAALGVLFFLTFYLSLFWGGIFWIYAKWRLYRISLLNALSFASLMVLGEYFRGWLGGGFPWELLGASQYKFLSFIQIADLGGVYLVSFLLFFLNYVAYAYLKEGSKPWKLYIFTLILLSLVLFYGHKQESKVWEKEQIKVALIQGNIPQDKKWDPKFQKETLERYLFLSNQAYSQRASLIFWPETAAPFYFSSLHPLAQKILLWSQEKNISLLIGAPRWDGQKIYNSLFLIDRGRIVGLYDKQHLVPFGEYIPGEKHFPWLRTFAVASGDYSPGIFSRPLVWKKDKILGPLICFESIFPRLAARKVLEGATILVISTNDAWFGKTAGPYQHFSQAIFRAIENRRYVVRVANTGISGLIDPRGQVILKTSLQKTEASCGWVGFLSYLTYYTKYGKYEPGFYIFLLFYKICIDRRRRNEK